MKKAENTMREQAQLRAESMRNKAMAAAKKRKEEFLGARVPKELRDRVIEEAKEQGISVSILIRKILEEAFSDQVSVSKRYQHGAAQHNSVSSERNMGPEAFPSVLGWEEIKLNRQVACSGCGRTLQPGGQVTVGLSATGGSPVVLCNGCKGSIEY